MKAPIRAIAASLLLALVLTAPASAVAKTGTGQVQQSPNTPSSGELIDQPKQWDGREIDFTGEVITQAMVRGDYAWIHVNDDAYYKKNVEEGETLGGYNSGHAVWLPATLVRLIKHYGDYRHEGDIVRVRGTFNAACAQHGGDMDIHATSLEVITPGHVVVDPIKPWKPIAALVLFALAGVIWVAHRRAEHLETFGPIGSKK